MKTPQSVFCYGEWYYRKKFIQIRGKTESQNRIFSGEIRMNGFYFTLEERCCLREYYVKGKSYREIARLFGQEREFGIGKITAEAYIFRKYPEVLSVTAQKINSQNRSRSVQHLFRVYCAYVSPDIRIVIPSADIIHPAFPVIILTLPTNRI